MEISSRWHTAEELVSMSFDRGSCQDVHPQSPAAGGCGHLRLAWAFGPRGWLNPLYAPDQSQSPRCRTAPRASSAVSTDELVR
ncbi:MAG TPA: hypothetical protein PK472_08300 [Pseudomonadota bacterium]|nr:hypothetical protein [Pseudomonadota bacterium]HND10420.1 hypothetical protein [Pseudomonadota bacterium]